MKRIIEYTVYALSLLAVASVGLILFSLFTGNVLLFILCVLYLIFFIFGETKLSILTKLWHKAGKRWSGEGEPPAELDKKVE